MDEEEQTTDQKASVPTILKWLETLLITGFFLAFNIWYRPEDPFYLNGNFPWTALGALLVGLRYGFFMALVSALILIAALGLHLRLGMTAETGFPYVWTIGVLGVSLLAGEFRDYWERQRQRLEASNEYRGSRLEEFTRNYYLLKVSHDRLEQQLAGSSSSLREALRRLYAQIDESGETGLNRQSAALMLQLLMRYGQLQIAGIYAVTDGRPEAEPLATLGRFRKVNPRDPLLQHALTERKLVSVQTEFRKRMDELDTDLLAVIPLIDSQDRFIGLCVIEAMPFFSFEARSLRLLAILAGHMADIVHEQTDASAGDTPDWRALRRHLARVGRDAETFSLPAAMAGLSLPDDQTGALVADFIQKIRRWLDVIAEHTFQGRRQIVILMPLTDELGLAGYLQRLDDGLREQLGLHVSDLPMPKTLQISDRAQAEQWLQDFVSPDQQEIPYGR
ncbi:PelD GGDEF domain-containing protein [Marinobacter halotolerans]|uniref:PelD GGDEF domain-containing protein n=1 Tax=Marinobacter halotolerans TaxID=1569211 RepID=UPI00124535F7|nr:PelD GGDEF domain-containing protein [Marinobacter halotolerans]